MDLKDLKACVRLVLPLQCDTRGCELTEEAMESLLEATQHKVPLQELHVVYEVSGDFDQTALALEHLRWNSYCRTDTVPTIHLLMFAHIFKQSDKVYWPAVSCFPLPLSPLQSTGFSISTSGGSGMRKMKTMTLTTLFVVWSLVSGCEHTVYLCDDFVVISAGSFP